ncbi:MAG: OmpA family protein [Myxococcota bacterium]
MLLRITILAALLATGCVPKKKYDALQEELTNTKSQLQEKTDSAASLEEALAAEKAKANELSRKLNELIADNTKLDASVAEMEAAMAELLERKAAADARIAEYKDLLGKFKSLIDAGKLKVKIADGRMVVELASDLLFPSGSAALSPDGEKAIAEVAGVLATIQDREYQVEGHTDNDPIRTERFPSNWELGAGRAITVVQALKKGGVEVVNLSAASFAENRPVEPNDSPEHKAANRRIEIVVVPDLSLLPGYEELEEIAGK